jgi:cytochrome c553
VDDAIVRTGTMPAPTSAMPRSNAAAPSPQAQTGGAYLATIGGCTSCHGADLAGGNRFGDVVAPAISRAGIGTWSLHDFQTAMRTGTTPGGHVLAKIMPWESIGMMTDDELRTLYNFLEAQPATTR